LRASTANAFPSASSLARKVAARIDRHQAAISELVERSTASDVASIQSSFLDEDRRVAAARRKDREEHAARLRAAEAAQCRERKREAARMQRMQGLRQRTDSGRKKLQQTEMMREVRTRADEAFVADRQEQYEWEETERRLLKTLDKQLADERRIERERETLRQAKERQMALEQLNAAAKRRHAGSMREDRRLKEEREAAERERRKEEAEQWRLKNEERQAELERQRDEKKRRSVQWERRRRARMTLEQVAQRTALQATTQAKSRTGGSPRPSLRSASYCPSSVFASPQRDGQWVPLSTRMGLRESAARRDEMGKRSLSPLRSASPPRRAVSADGRASSASPAVAEPSQGTVSAWAAKDEWECADCSFVNPGNLLRCDVCQAPRPTPY